MEHDTCTPAACQSPIGMVAHPTTPWTETPNWIFDEAAPTLDGAPLKVLLYIARRTRGFHRESDAISLEQFVSGITTRDGRQLDQGCGVRNRTTVLKALADLEHRGYIGRAHGRPGRGKDATTLYFLRGPVAASGQRGTASAPQDDGATSGAVHSAHLRGVQPAHPQKKVVLKQSSFDNDTIAHTHNAASESKTAEPPLEDGTPPVIPLPPSCASIPRPSTNKVAPTGPREADPTDAHDDAERGAIDLAITALSVELGDDTPRASRARAHSLRRDTELSLPTFLALLDEAATRTRTYKSSITGRQRDGRHKAIQYLFAVLHDLIDCHRRPVLPAHIVVNNAAPMPASVASNAVSSAVSDDTAEVDPTWRAVLAELRTVLTPGNYARWFRPTSVVSHDENRKELFIGVPDAFHQRWLDQRLRGCIERALARVAPGVQLTFVVVGGTAATPGSPGVNSADAGLLTGAQERL